MKKDWNFTGGHSPHYQAIISDGNGETIAVTYDDKEAKNAQLIANAPNMAELLQWIVTEIETTPDELSDALLGMIKLKAQRQLNEL